MDNFIGLIWSILNSYRLIGKAASSISQASPDAKENMSLALV